MELEITQKELSMLLDIMESHFPCLQFTSDSHREDFHPLYEKLFKLSNQDSPRNQIDDCTNL